MTIALVLIFNGISFAQATKPASPEVIFPPLDSSVGIKLDLDVAWQLTDRTSGPYASVHTTRYHEGTLLLDVLEPGFTKSWLYYLSNPISIKDNPILVLRYRLANKSSVGAVLWIENGYLVPKTDMTILVNSELIADGQVHEIRKDLRAFYARAKKPMGDVVSALCWYFG